MHLHHHQQQQSLMHFAYVTSSFLNIYLIIGCLHTSIDALFYISFILIVFFFLFSHGSVLMDVHTTPTS